MSCRQNYIKTMLKSITRLKGASNKNIMVVKRFKSAQTIHFPSSMPSPSNQKKVTVKDLFKTPIFKSVLYTVAFGAAVLEFMKSRKETENLVATYNSKFNILHEIIDKLKKGEHVDINQELKIANTLTRYKYNTVTDIEIDEQLDKFLRLADQADDEKVEINNESIQETKQNTTSRPQIKAKNDYKSTKFL